MNKVKYCRCKKYLLNIINTKLTVTIDDSVINQAKAYVATQGRSLSAFVENYLKAVTTRENHTIDEDELSPIVKSLLRDRPKLTLPKDYAYKEELEKMRAEKAEKYWNTE